MIKLILIPKYPFLRLTDVGLRRQVERLQQANEELRARLVAAQQEKAVAQKQAEELRKEKERLRLKTVSLKRSADAQEKEQDVLKTKIQELREENQKLARTKHSKNPPGSKGFGNRI